MTDDGQQAHRDAQAMRQEMTQSWNKVMGIVVSLQSVIGSMATDIAQINARAARQDERLETHTAEIRAIGAELVEQSARIATGAAEDAARAHASKLTARTWSLAGIAAAVASILTPVLIYGPAWIGPLAGLLR